MKILKGFISDNLLKIQTKSLIVANKQRGEQSIRELLLTILRDIENQYSTFKINKNDFYTNIKKDISMPFKFFNDKGARFVEKDIWTESSNHC